MAAGKKRYRITIQRLKTEAEGLIQAASGKVDRGNAANWTTVVSRWAEIEEPGGTETQQDGQVRSEVTHLVRMDWDSGTKTITSAMRVNWDDGGVTRLLDITRANGKSKHQGGRRWKLELECKEHA